MNKEQKERAKDLQRLFDTCDEHPTDDAIDRKVMARKVLDKATKECWKVLKVHDSCIYFNHGEWKGIQLQLFPLKDYDHVQFVLNNEKNPDRDTQKVLGFHYIDYLEYGTKHLLIEYLI